MSMNNYCCLQKCLQICCVALFIVRCLQADGYSPHKQSAKWCEQFREKLEETKYTLITIFNSVVFGLQKYEVENALSAEILTRMEESDYKRIISQNLTLLLKLADHVRREGKAGMKTKIGQKDLIRWMANHLKETSPKIEVEKSENFLKNAEKEFEHFKSQLQVHRRAEESSLLLLFYHFFFWEIYANLLDEQEEEELLRALQKCPLLSHLNQQKEEVAELINNEALAVIKRHLLLGTPSTAKGIDLSNMLNVAIQASAFHLVKDRQVRREIDLDCLPYKSPWWCLNKSIGALGKSLSKLTEMTTATPEEILNEMEVDIGKWLQGEMAARLGILNVRVRTELAKVRTLSQHWKMDKEGEASFMVLFMLARFYRHLAEEIRHRFVQSPKTMYSEELKTAEKMDQFVRENLAGEKQIFEGTAEEKEQKHLRMKFMVIGPEIVTIGNEKPMMSNIGELHENGHLCKNLAIVLSWELNTENALEKQEKFREFVQKMASLTINNQVDKSQCLREIRKFSHKLEEMNKRGMAKGNRQFLHQILNKSTDVMFSKLDFTTSSAENEFYIKVARLLTELQGQSLTDVFDGEMLTILEEIKGAEEKLVNQFSTKEISAFLKKFASSIDHFESRIFRLKTANQLGDEWRKEEKDCLYKLLDILSRIIALKTSMTRQNHNELQTELEYFANEMAVLKAHIQKAFPSKVFATKELLESAVRFRKAFENFSSKKFFSMEEELAKEYNEFARRLERMDIGGLQRDMFGRFDLEKIDEKKETVTGLDAKLLELALELIRAYKQSGARDLALVKIRGVGHMTISIKLIDYDFMEHGPRRRKFRENLAEMTSIFSPDFSFPMTQWGMMEVGKADKVFYEMVQTGWHYANYDKENRDCRTFAYVFICRLFDGKCPLPGMWPKNFIDIAYEAQNSVFTMSSELMANDRKSRLEKNDQCELKEYRIEFQIEIDVPEKEGILYQTMLPPIVQYQTGKFVGHNYQGKGEALLEEVLTLVQVESTHLAGKEGKFFEAKLMAYDCTLTTSYFGFPSVEQHAYVRKITLRDRTNSTGFKTMGIPEELDLHEQAKLPVIRITGTGKDLRKEEIEFV